MLFLLRTGIGLLDQANVVTFQHNSAKCLAFALCLDVVFFSVIKNKIHVFVKSDNCSFYSEIDVFEDPDTDTRAVLKVSEDQIDGLNHHLKKKTNKKVKVVQKEIISMNS